MTSISSRSSIDIRRAGTAPPRGSRAPARVDRSSIVDGVTSAGHVKLVLVWAPAGYGKTTLLQQLRERFETAGATTAWLTLEPADNDLPRFLGSLRKATSVLLPQFAGGGSPL